MSGIDLNVIHVAIVTQINQQLTSITGPWISTWGRLNKRVFSLGTKERCSKQTNIMFEMQKWNLEFNLKVVNFNYGEISLTISAHLIDFICNFLVIIFVKYCKRLILREITFTWVLVWPNEPVQFLNHQPCVQILPKTFQTFTGPKKIILFFDFCKLYNIFTELISFFSSLMTLGLATFALWTICTIVLSELYLFLHIL